MTGFKLWSLVFRCPSAMLTLVLIVIHQGIIASSVYFLAQVVGNLADGAELLTYLILYMGAMILPFVPGCTSFVIMQRWINVAHSRVIAHLVIAARGKVELLRCSDKKEVFESAVSRNAYGAVAGFIGLTHDFCSLWLNSVFSMAVIGWLLPSELILGYGISLVAALVIVGLFNGTAQSRSSEMEKSYSSYGNCLARAWDNAVVGNSHNYEIWSKESLAVGREYYRGMLGLVAFKQSGNVAIAFASLLPTAYLIYSIAAAGSASPTVLAVIVVNLTRIFHILNSLGMLIYQMLEWSAMKARLCYLFAVRDSLEESPGLPQIPPGHVTMNGDPVPDFPSVIESLACKRNGRFTVRGANGSGKSTLLVAMKKAYANSAFLLPPLGNDLSWQNDYRNCSTGQTMRAVLEEACAASRELRYLLLDEWDANLDRANRDSLDGLLARMSQRFVVVEVRH